MWIGLKVKLCATAVNQLYSYVNKRFQNILTYLYSLFCALSIVIHAKRLLHFWMPLVLKSIIFVKKLQKTTTTNSKSARLVALFKSNACTCPCSQRSLSFNWIIAVESVNVGWTGDMYCELWCSIWHFKSSLLITQLYIYDTHTHTQHIYMLCNESNILDYKLIWPIGIVTLTFVHFIWV